MDLRLFGVDGNGNVIISNNGSTLSSQIVNFNSDICSLNVFNYQFTGNLRVAIGYYVNEQNYGVYEIYPTVYTVS